MRLLLTGATGLVGRRLVLDRLERGDQLIIVSRSRARASTLFAADANPNIEIVEGDPTVPGAWQSSADGCDGVVHLAGAGVADRRWSSAYKTTIVDSRVDGTYQVVEAIRAAQRPPGVLVNASAIGWYGDTGDRAVDESAPANKGDFFGDLVVRWEHEAGRAEEAGTRAVMLRVGLVLDERGGLIARLRAPFRLFVGGPIGAGRRFMSWIHWRDLVGLVDLALTNPGVRGPINATAPHPVTNRVFSRAFARALGRPSLVPVPPPALRVALGEFARYVLQSQRVIPARAIEHGYRFIHPEIGPALESLLAPRPAASDGETMPAVPAPAAARPPAPVRLLAVGIDGTLLRSDERLPRSVVQACRAAQDAGCVIVLATARPPRSTHAIAEALSIEGPMINYNGAVIWNPIEHRAQFHEPLDGEIARSVIDAARAIEPNVAVGIEVLDRWFTDRLDPALVRASPTAIEPDGVGPLDEHLAGPVTQVNLLGTPAQIAAIRPGIETRFWRPRAVGLFPAGGALLQITHPLVDKSIAIQRIVARLGAAREAVMAVGTGANDTGMLEWAGFGVATANASESVRRIADEVVPSNDEHGVAVAIRRFLTDA